ncbi:MAG: helix-turn-helix transcriptional regulator [Verrucomicrobia bacterium]|nr:helix-turn-helix transcriptional regulator [Verrucomicrobiota bacterium]
MDPTIKTRLLLRPVVSPIGTIRLAGVNKGGFGVGFGRTGPRTIDCFGMTYILRGQGTYRDDHGIERPVTQDDAVLFFPGRPHACGTKPGEFWDEFWFEFDGPVFDLMLQKGLLDPRQPVHHASGSDYWFRRLFDIVSAQHSAKETPAHLTISRFVLALMELLADSRSAQPPAPQPDWVEKARALLADEHMTAGKIALVARKLGFTYDTFRKRFRAELGYSPGQFYMDARIDRAAALLHKGGESVKTISARLGFCDEFHFSRCFKRRMGQSPTEFRRRVRGE